MTTLRVFGFVHPEGGVACCCSQCEPTFMPPYVESIAPAVMDQMGVHPSCDYCGQEGPWVDWRLPTFA